MKNLLKMCCPDSSNHSTYSKEYNMNPKSPRLFFALAILPVLFIDCATMQSLDISKRTRTFDADYNSTMKAALDYLTAEGWQISTVDKDLGLINTEFKSISGLSAILSGEERYKINLSLQKVSASQTRVMATMLYERKTGKTAFRDGEWTQAIMTEKQAQSKYKEILDGIQSRIVK